MPYTVRMDTFETGAPKRDAIPLEHEHETHGPSDTGMMTHRFYAFNTVVTLQAYADPDRCRTAFEDARDACRSFERSLSRTLPHSDIARLNASEGAPTPIGADTAQLLNEALRYCADSEGRFDITMGAAVRLWDFHKGIMPDQMALEEALSHVDWRGMHVKQTDGGWEARLDDPQAAVDVGGIAKGWIADRLAELLASHGLESFIVNLGGNVVAHGQKPDGSPWRIGLQDPRDKHALVGAVAIREASAVTSGVYERCFTQDGTLYHHILDPETGYPAQTDAAGVTVLARRSIDAEGYSTTLLALGIERGCTFAREHPAIFAAYFVNAEGNVIEA